MTTEREALPLSDARPTCRFIAFPLKARVGKIRDVAEKMLTKTTERHAGYYRDQVTAAIESNLRKLGLGETERSHQIQEFWRQVEAEMNRRTYGAGANNPKGAA